MVLSLAIASLDPTSRQAEDQTFSVTQQSGYVATACIPVSPLIHIAVHLSLVLSPSTVVADHVFIAQMAERGINEIIAGETLAPVSDLQDYGATIIAELDKAETELDNSTNQPFSGMNAEVMRDMASLRERQFDMFRRHVEIEQGYKIENAASDGNDVQRMSFSGIAKTMRKKESATAGLLDKLAQFDQQLRIVVDKFEVEGERKAEQKGMTARRRVDVEQENHTVAPDT